MTSTLQANGGELPTQAPDEREAIVRWLREKAYYAVESAQYCRSGNAGRSLIRKGQYLRDLAFSIERGDHLPSEQGEGYE